MKLMGSEDNPIASAFARSDPRVGSVTGLMSRLSGEPIGSPPSPLEAQPKPSGMEVPNGQVPTDPNSSVQPVAAPVAPGAVPLPQARPNQTLFAPDQLDELKKSLMVGAGLEKTEGTFAWRAQPTKQAIKEGVFDPQFANYPAQTAFDPEQNRPTKISGTSPNRRSR